MSENNVPPNGAKKGRKRSVIVTAISVLLFAAMYQSLVWQDVVLNFGIENIVREPKDGDFAWPMSSFDLVWYSGDYLSRALIGQDDYLYIAVRIIGEDGRELTANMSPKEHPSTGVIEYHNKRGEFVEARTVEVATRIGQTLRVQFPFKDGGLYARGGRVTVQFISVQPPDAPFAVSVTYVHTFSDKTTQRITRTFLLNQNGVVELPQNPHALKRQAPRPSVSDGSGRGGASAA